VAPIQADYGILVNYERVAHDVDQGGHCTDDS